MRNYPNIRWENNGLTTFTWKNHKAVKVKKI